jgi:lysozyme family protein
LARQGEHPRPVDAIQMDEVESIYLEYWENARCGNMPPPLDIHVFDVSINSGHVKAIVLLQRALCMPKNLHTGNFGPITRKTLSDRIAADGIDAVCKAYLDERRKFYRNRVALEPSQQRFIGGWLARVDHMERILA